jgi:accessory gene regulator protein AgrB
LDQSQTGLDETAPLMQNCAVTVAFTVIYMSLALGLIIMVVFVTDLHINVWAAFGVGLIGGLVLMCAVIHLLFALQRYNSGLGCPCG